MSDHREQHSRLQGLNSVCISVHSTASVWFTYRERGHLDRVLYTFMWMGSRNSPPPSSIPA